MRCYCCNEILSPVESRLRFGTSREFTETCRKCLDTMDTPVLEMTDEYVDEDICSLDELMEEENLFDSYDESEEG